MTVARAGQWVVALNPDGSNIGSAGGSTTITGNVTSVPFSSTSVGSNTAPTTSPGASAVIATASTTSAGTWQADITVNVGGTVAVGDEANLNLVNGAQIIRLANGTGSASTKFSAQFILANAAAIQVNTVSAGTVGSVYSATVVLTRVI